MKPKTTGELFDEAFARHGCKRIHVGYTPPKRKARSSKAAKSGGNGKAR